MTSDPRFRVPLVVVTSVLIHTAVTSQLRIGDTSPDLLILLPVTAGMVAGRSIGAAMGFGTGMALDLFLTSPFGLSALVYCLLGYLVGAFQGGLVAVSPSVTALAALAASAVGVLLYAASSAVLGQPVAVDRLVTVVGLVSVVNALASPLALRVTRWALVDRSRSRVMA